ncbi:Ger(x)C family spore germination protein [Bacillus sp. UNC438CL73TsuS30]|uniref:Ger(x)C family spore germination protein n=1 Tax=Bacillus sp. UNC438CL73TsuS30 TaxID=1340434 RepID=UPI00047B84EE|nr:Ger(x)C family spore germination protein [Bacillus sp. UNC438CL73TsuS30]
MNSFFKKYLLTLMIILTFLLGGCGFKDLDKRFFVVSIGVDIAKNSPKRYLVSLKFAIPAISKDSPSEYQIVSEEGDSIGEAVRMIKTKVDREIDFSHAKVVVYGEELIKQTRNAGIHYWFTRRRDVQEIAWVAIGKPDALAVLKVRPKSETIPSNSLFLSLGKDGSETPYVLSQYVYELKRKLIEKGVDPFLPIIEAKKGLFEINKVGLLDKNRLKLTLTPDETKVVNFLLNLEEKSALTGQRGKVKFTINTEKVKSNYKIYTPKGKPPYIKVDFFIKGTIEDASRRISNQELSKYERAAEISSDKLVKQVLKKIQKANLDPIGFGLHYRARHFNKNDWEEWQRIYPNITFRVNSKFQITDTGLIE